MATDASAAAAVASADDEAMLCKMTPSHWKDGHLVPTYFVSQKPRRGFFRRIRDALNQAPPYSRVEIVGGGTFHEKLVLEKPVEIGASKSNEPPVVTHKTTPLTLNAAEAFVEGIAVEVEWSIPSCVVSRGSPTIKWCFFQGVEVLGTSTPNLVECKIVDAKIHGLRVAGQAGGLYTKNTIWGHTGYSIMVESTGEPTFSYNIISESQSGQIYVKNGEDDGLVAPTFLLNRISDNITTAQNTQISTGVDDHLVLPSYKLDALPVKETGMRVLLMPVEDRGEAVRFDDDDVVNDPIMKNTNPRCAVLVSGSRTKPTFTRNAISTCQMHGFFVRGNSAGTYESNFVTGNKGWGIIVEGGATAAIFTGNQVGSNGGGVKVTGAPATFTDNNLLYGNRGPQLLLESGHERFLCERTIIKSGSRLGVWCAGEGGGTFRGNDFDKCGVGVRLERFASPTFERNSFDGGGIGLYAHTAALGDFIECQFNDLTVAAIVLATAADPHFVQVQIVACSIGVLVTSGGHGVFDQCIVRDARKFGFDVSDGGQPRVVRSEVRGSRQDGLRVWKRGGGHFRNNIFACNEGAQVRITRTADPLLEENFIGHTAHDGVVIEDGGLGVLCQNLIRSCYGSGINATGSASAPVIRGNYVVGCGNYGIHLTQCGFGTIEKNIILNCRRANIAISGMALTEKSKNGTNNNNNNDAGKGEGGGEKAATQAKAKQRLVLRGNVIRGSAWCGILIERQTKVALIQNIISDNVQGIVVRGLSDVVAIRNQLALSTHGILVDEDSSVQLFCNLFHAMSGTALCVLSAVKLVMQWCFISHCATGAIMRRAQRGIFGDNVVRSCHQYGLVLGADCRTHITRNLLTDNLVDIFLSDAHCHADCYDNCLMRSTGQSVRVLGEKMDLASFHGNVILSAAVGVCAMRGNLKLRHCLVLNCGEGVVASRVPPSTLPGDHLHPASDDVTSTSTTRSPATPTPQVPTNATILEHCFIGCCGVGGRTGCPSGVALRRSLLTQNDVGFVFRGSAASFIIDASICINSAAVGILACDGAAGTVSNTIFMKNFINVAMVTGATTAMGKCVMQAAVVFSCFMSGAGVMPHLTNCLITSHASAVRHGVHTKEMSEKRDVVETALRKIMGALNVLHPNLEARKETPVDHGAGAISEVQDSRHSPRPTGGALAKLRGKRSPREESVGGAAASSLTGRSSAMRRMAGASITMAGSSTHSARFGSSSPLRPPRASPPPVAVVDSARMPPLVARGADINEADFYAIQRLPSLWADVYEEGSAWRHRDAGSRDFIQPTAQDVSAMLATGTSVDLHLARRVRTNMELLAAPFPENKRRSAILWPSNTSVETTFGGPGGPFLLHRLANSGAAKTSALMMAGGEMAGAATNTLARERFVYVCSGVWLDDGCNPTFDNCYLGEHCHVGANLSRQVGPDGNQGWATDVRPLAASAAPLAFQPLLRHNSTLAASSTHRRRSIGGGGGGGSRAPLPSSVGRSARGGDASSSRYRGTSFTMTTTIVGGGSTASGGGAGAGPANAAVYRPPTIAALCEGSSLLVQLLKLGSPCFWRQLLVTGALPESFPLFTTPGTTTNASEGKSSAMSSERRTGRAVDFGAIHFAPHLQAIDSVATSRIAGCGVIASGGAKGTFYRCTFGRNNHAAVLGDGATTAFKYTKFEAHTSTTVIMEEECCGLLQNCIFRDGRSIPLEVRGHNTSPTIEGNEFTESPFTAISCSLRATPTIVGNRLTAILARAIVVQELAAPIIERNRFDTCTCGVLFQSQSRGRADKNTFNDCSSYGILVEDSGTSPSLRSNNISNGRNAGIGVNGRGCIPLVADNALNDNVIGIHLQRGAQGIYRANILRRQQTGIQVEDSSGEFRRNMLTESVLAGIVVSGSGASPVLVENRIALGRLVGLRVRHAQGQVCRNYVGQNGGDGIVVEGKHTEVVLCANEVSENAGGGLRLMKGCVPIVWANIITQNQKGGILVENTDTSPLMEGNIIKLNEVVGVQFGPDARGYLNGGIVSNTLRGPAVMIQGKGGASLQEMVIADSDQGGVVVRAEGECEVVRCIFINCQGPPALSLASSATGIRITASIFVENGTSLVVESGGSGDCTACAFLGAHTSQTAVKVMRDGTPSFQHCIFAAGKIGFQDAGKARLSRCLFFNLACGAELSGTSTMMECEFRECQSGARPLRNLTLLSGCLFASCKVGLHLADYGQPTVEECAMLRCQRGILAEGNSGGTVRNCRILWNTDNVVVADGAGPNLSSNLIYDASNIGLHVRGGHPVVLQNDIFDSHYTTVLVDAANGGRLEENRISFAREGGALVMNGESARELASNNNTVRNAFSPPGNALFRAVGERNQFYRRNESETERLSPSYLDMRRFIEDVCASTMLRVTTMASRAAAKVVATKDWVVRDGWLGELSSLTGAAAHSTNTTTTPATTTTTTGEAAFTPLQPPPHNESQSRPRGGRPGKPDGTAPTGTPTTMAAPTTPTSTGGADGTTALAMDEPLRSRFDRLPRDVVNAAGRFPAQDHLRRYAGGDEELLSAEATLANIGDDLSGHSITDFDAVMLPSITPPPALTRATSVAAASTTRTVMNSTPAPRALVSPPMEAARRQQEECLPAPMLSTVLHQTKTKLVHVLDALSPPSSNNMINVPYEGIIYRTPMPSVLSMVNEQAANIFGLRFITSCPKQEKQLVSLAASVVFPSAASFGSSKRRGAEGLPELSQRRGTLGPGSDGVGSVNRRRGGPLENSQTTIMPNVPPSAASGKAAAAAANSLPPLSTSRRPPVLPIIQPEEGGGRRAPKKKLAKKKRKK